jgi:hypothetical protein
MNGKFECERKLKRKAHGKARVVAASISPQTDNHLLQQWSMVRWLYLHQSIVFGAMHEFVG